MTPVTLIAFGGVLTMAGSALPWMSMFAGLKQYPGLLGLNGWMVLAIGGALALVPLMERRGVHTSPLAIILSLFALAVSGYAITGLRSITGDMGNALMVPRMGPGLPVAIAGSIISAVAAGVAIRHGRIA